MKAKTEPEVSGVLIYRKGLEIKRKTGLDTVRAFKKAAQEIDINPHALIVAFALYGQNGNRG